jgi:hypothetical protein
MEEQDIFEVIGDDGFSTWWAAARSLWALPFMDQGQLYEGNFGARPGRVVCVSDLKIAFPE